MAVSRLQANCCGGGDSGGAGIDNKFTWATQDEGYVDATANEVFLWQWLINFDDAVSATIQARMTAWGKVAAGTGTYNLRVGGTRSGVDGTIVATFTTASGAYVQLTNFGAAFANPFGSQIVKLCLANTGSNRTWVQGASFSLG